jgi:hypothetical protein
MASGGNGAMVYPALPQSRFVNPVDETLVCAICLLVPHPTNALQHKNCDHIGNAFFSHSLGRLYFSHRVNFVCLLLRCRVKKSRT